MMTDDDPRWHDIDVEVVQDRLSQRLGVAVQDDEDFITLIACLAHDFAANRDVNRNDSLRDVRETVRDWLAS